MIPQLNIGSAGAVETETAWTGLSATPAASPRKTRLLLLALALAAGLLVVASSNDWIARTMDGLIAGWNADRTATAKAAKAKAVARLIAETEADSVTPVVEGEDAVTRNALLPVSTLPVEAARPFFMPKLSAMQSTNAERCLTQAIYYEAATEPDSGKAAVAQVILNRMRHPAYPNTVCGVVYQGSSRPGCQFSFACNGALYARRESAAWREARRVATNALSGAVIADIGSATHFHTTGVSPNWGPSLARVSQVGLHVFYRLATNGVRAAVHREPAKSEAAPRVVYASLLPLGGGARELPEAEIALSPAFPVAAPAVEPAHAAPAASAAALAVEAAPVAPALVQPAAKPAKGVSEPVVPAQPAA